MASSTGSTRIQAKSETHSTAEVVELLPRPTSLDAPATQAHMFPQLHISPAGRPETSTPTSPTTTTSTATQVATGSSTTPSTTLPPDQSSNPMAHGNGTSSTSATAAPSSPTNNKGHMLDGSQIAVAGAAIGAVGFDLSVFMEGLPAWYSPVLDL
ncbi:hypothetical protein CNMCM5878_005705 [Aspergillus fumigatiaffinis]|nr:hypothetical protein CNMCM5878_005705 [Aspergillus fumigatiaffinis]KAF4229959.1 hypothetical protein CNMCM6457_006205 [Aspergillus fumigatiaffinis]